MKTREISEAPAGSALARTRQLAHAPTAPLSASQRPSFLSKQTHSGGPQPVPSAAALSAPYLELRPRRIQPQPHEAAPQSEQRRALSKRSQQPGAKASPAAQYPLPAVEQTHCGGPLPAPNEAVSPESDLECFPRPIQPEPDSTAGFQPRSPIWAKRSHPNGTQSGATSASASSFAATFPFSVREQSHFEPGRSTPNPIKARAHEPHSAAAQLQNPPAMAEQTHCAPNHKSAATPSTARPAAQFPSSVREQTQSSEPRRHPP
jgi:hypothetical protein